MRTVEKRWISLRGTATLLMIFSAERRDDVPRFYTRLVPEEVKPLFALSSPRGRGSATLSRVTLLASELYRRLHSLLIRRSCHLKFLLCGSCGLAPFADFKTRLWRVPRRESRGSKHHELSCLERTEDRLFRRGICNELVIHTLWHWWLR